MAEYTKGPPSTSEEDIAGMVQDLIKRNANLGKVEKDIGSSRDTRGLCLLLLLQRRVCSLFVCATNSLPACCVSFASLLLTPALHLLATSSQPFPSCIRNKPGVHVFLLTELYS